MWMHRHFPAIAILITGMVLVTTATAQSQESLKRQQALAYYADESRIDELLANVSARHHPQNLAICDVKLISMTEGRAIPNQTVIVEKGRISKVGPSSSIKVPSGMPIIDGKGEYLVPGLTDMHVHEFVSSSQHLLNLMEGVTTIRDMDGFPWTLRVRENVRRDALLAPNMYITGQILNGEPMGFYARVVTTPDAGREAVRADKAAGFDFIKVHNIMKPEVYEAVLDEAHMQRIDVVGHIPHGITVSEAIRLGQKTIEHFKGYILDNRLTISDEDYVTATKGADVWLCPTFSTYRQSLRGPDVLQALTLPEMRYASWRDRLDWKQRANERTTQLTQARQRILPMEEHIFKQLLPIGARFIAGTDSGGGYALMPPGFILHEELRLLQENGLSPFETLKTATVNAAAAMNRSAEFGSIERGKRADMILVTADPLADSANLLKIQTVIVRGIVLERKDLDEIGNRIRGIYDPQPTPTVATAATALDIKEMMRRMELLHQKGYVFRTQDLETLETLLREEGYAADAARAAGLN